MTSFYNHQRGYYTSNKPFYKRQQNQHYSHHTPSRAAAPRPHHNQPRYRYYQPCNATHIDDLIYGPAITMAMSERSIFAPFEHPATIHMPPVSKKPHSRRSSRKSFYASLYDPLETTTKEPLEPYDDPITANASDDGSSSSSSSTSSLSTARINDSSHHNQRRSSSSKPVTPQTHRPEYYYQHHHHHHPQQYPELIHQYPCYYPLPPPPPQYAYYHYYQVPAMTTSPTASSSSSTSVAEIGGSNATTVTTTDHPYANPTGRTDPEEVLADDLHRRASTISDAITTASSAEICRRFSNGSTSSTAASSMVSLPDEKQAIAAPVVSPLATPPPPSDEPTVTTSSSDDEEDEPSPVTEEPEAQPDIEPEVEETEPEAGTSDDDTLPVWADPDRVRENPTRYEFVKEYMKRHSIPKTSSMPLPNTCTFYFSETLATKHQKTPTANYMSTVRPMFDCQTVWDFSSRWRRYKQVCSRPSQMQHNQNLYCFLKGVAPMWEDATNKSGGRLTLCPARADLDDLFDWVLASFVGGKLAEDGMVGVVLSKRSRGDRIELWLDGSASMDTIPTLKSKLCQHLSEHLCTLVMASRYKKHFDSK